MGSWGGMLSQDLKFKREWCEARTRSEALRMLTRVGRGEGGGKWAGLQRWTSEAGYISDA